MMITKEDITKMARHIFRRKRGIPDKRSMHPVRDWLGGLTFAVILFLAGSSYAGVLFLNMLNGERKVELIDDPVVRYEQEAAVKVLTKYQKRVETFERLRSEGKVFVAPDSPPETDTEVVEETNESAPEGVLESE